MSKSFTLREVLTAIYQNGYKQAYGYFIRGKGGRFIRKDYTPDEVGAACAIGQGAVNLRVNPIKLKGALDGIYTQKFGTLSSYIIRANDGDRKPVRAIASTLLENLPDDDLNRSVIVYD